MDTALQLLSNITAFIVVASLKGAVLIAGVLFIQKFAASHLSASARYLLWFPVVIALIVPVGFDLRLPVNIGVDAAPSVTALDASVNSVAAVAASSGDARLAEANTLSAPRSAAQVAMMPPDSNARISWFSVLQGVWLAGVGSVLGAVVFSCHRFSRIVRRAMPAEAATQSLLDECAMQTGCRASVRVYRSSDVDVPMIAGLLYSVLLLPEGLEGQLTRTQLRHVFIHELMHLQRGDIVSNWIVALVQALHWFNPAVWFAFFRMRQDRELACDAATLRHLAPAERASYGHTLLQLNDTLPGKPVPALALGILESTSALEQRISMLVQSSRQRKLQPLFSALVLLPLAAIAVGQPTGAPAAPRTVITAPAPAAEPARPVAARVGEAPVPVAQAPAVVEQASRAVMQATRPVTQASAAAAETPAAAVEAPVAVEEENAPRPVSREPVTERPVVPTTIPAEPAATDAFAPDTSDTSFTLAALSNPSREAAPSAPVESLASTIQQLAGTIATKQADTLRYIEEWEPLATECAARKDASLFGTLSKPCREVRVIQIRGDVFHFVYDCHRLQDLHRTQRRAYQGALARQEPGLAGVVNALDANEQGLHGICDMDAYAQYPGLSKMIADAEALKYYNPWRKPVTPLNQHPLAFETTISDPLIYSRMSDMPPR